jgi:hypothetical protein
MNGAWVVLAAVVLAACGSDPRRSPPATDGTGGATGGSGGTTAGTGAGTSSGAGGGGSGGEGATGGSAGQASEPYGFVQFGTIFHYPEPGLGYRLATAAFYRARPATGAGPCTTTSFGPCSLTSCDPNPTPEPEPEPEPEPDSRPAPTAGDISIRTSGDFTVDLVPDAIGIYVPTAQDGLLLGQESATVTAAGADVPAFTHTMSVPLLLLLTEPALAEGETVVTVPRNEDLVLRWDRGVEGLDVQVQSAGGVARLYCNAPSEDGTLTVERAALGPLDPGTELLLLGAASERVTAGDYTVTLSTAGSVMSPDRTRRPVLVVE